LENTNATEPLMKIKSLHSWICTPQEASEIQIRLQRKVSQRNQFKKIKYLAGCDTAFDLKNELAFAGVIVYSFPQLKEIDRQCAVYKTPFPYIPGMLAFREAPVLLAAIEKLKIKPDLFVFDGHGLAHPRRFGIASHLGVYLNKPTIGCAKSRLCGEYKEPNKKAGSISKLTDKEGKVIGAVVRTRDHVRPIFISIGHKIDLDTSCKMILKCVGRYRVPKPTREADLYAEAFKRSYNEYLKHHPAEKK